MAKGSSPTLGVTGSHSSPGRRASNTDSPLGGLPASLGFPPGQPLPKQPWEGAEAGGRKVRRDRQTCARETETAEVETRDAGCSIIHGLIKDARGPRPQRWRRPLNGETLALPFSLQQPIPCPGHREAVGAGSWGDCRCPCNSLSSLLLCLPPSITTQSGQDFMDYESRGGRVSLPCVLRTEAAGTG